MSIDSKSIYDKTSPPISAKTPSSDPVGGPVTIEGVLSQDTYDLKPENWYTAKPYGFKVQLRSEDLPITMFLPINPSNLTISTHFATNLIPTLYGTVEEHSDIRYFDITIEGTTGMAPKYATPSQSDPNNAQEITSRSGRASYQISRSISVGGFFSKSLAVVNQLKQKASSFGLGNPKIKTGITQENTGYVAFHNLYRLLMLYKKDASGVSDNSRRKPNWHPITFFNYKDNNEYDVVVRSFTMRKSAENPMLYMYSIQLTGYNIRSVGTDLNDEDVNQRLVDLGLSGVDGSSVLGNIKSIANQAKSVVGSFVGGINTLGR
jgi:hypothetical protein